MSDCDGALYLSTHDEFCKFGITTDSGRTHQAWRRRFQRAYANGQEALRVWVGPKGAEKLAERQVIDTVPAEWIHSGREYVHRSRLNDLSQIVESSARRWNLREVDRQRETVTGDVDIWAPLRERIVRLACDCWVAGPDTNPYEVIEQHFLEFGMSADHRTLSEDLVRAGYPYLSPKLTSIASRAFIGAPLSPRDCGPIPGQKHRLVG